MEHFNKDNIVDTLTTTAGFCIAFLAMAWVKLPLPVLFAPQTLVVILALGLGATVLHFVVQAMMLKRGITPEVRMQWARDRIGKGRNTVWMLLPLLVITIAIIAALAWANFRP